MRIQFCGADRTVTGSSHLIELAGRRILLDMGLYQGPRHEARLRNEYLPCDPATLDAIILSHGHLDHCGKLPVAVRAGFKGPIYCTPATAAVARIVLEDAAEIQVEDASYLNRRARQPGEPPIEPLYRPDDLPAVFKLFRTVPYEREIDLGNGVRFSLRDAGHILGSSYVILRHNGRTLLFTADVGRYDTPIIPDPAAPPGPADIIITESTYGDRTHGPMSEIEPQLLDAVRTILQSRGRLLVPAFALGRTQTMLWYLQKFISEKQIPPLPVFVDSPMGVEISKVYSEYRDSYDAQTRQLIGSRDLFGLSRVTFASTSAQSKAINAQSGPAVIIASSPTCEFGRILHHLKQSVERPADMVLFVGWTPPSTLGRRLQDGQKRVRIYDRWYDLRCQVRTLHGLSAHADGAELLRFLRPALSPRTSVFIVHGEADQAEGLARRIKEAGADEVTIPALDTVVLE